MDKLELRHRLQKRYHRGEWMETAKAVFQKVSFFDKPQSLEVKDKIVKTFNQLGFVRLGDGKNLAIFEVEVAEHVNISRNKVQLRNITTRFIDEENSHGVLVIYDQGKDAYRFTFSAKDSTFNNNLELEIKETAPKRYTYVLGKGEACTTAAERLHQLSLKNGDTKLNDFVEAFSVEKLNKDFFKNYKAVYEKFWKHIASVPSYLKAFKIKNGQTDEETEKNQKPIRDFTKKLLGRIVFLHFLQRKGWLGCPVDTQEWKGGDPQFMKNLFGKFPHQDKFLSECLKELFFSTLNNNQRKQNVFSLTGTRIPYLNGGLFDDDTPHANSVNLPSDYFEQLFTFLEQYNFTIDENSPDDQEVGIDPEMLGHIFENLLEENREKGAFYTPKEIVNYMCQESLLQYLRTNLSEVQDVNGQEYLALEKLVRQADVGKREDKKNYIIGKAKRIEELLDKVKICDPAIGSGAFPMGILQEIFKIKMALDLTLDPAKVKKDIIQNTIYGVDIEKGAVDIARLRFWLALVVDEEAPQPLPNLDYKIMQGNSLLERFEGIDLRFEKKKYESTAPKATDLFGQIINPQVSIADYLQESEGFSISELEEKYFNSNNADEKRSIREKISELEKDFIDEQLDIKRGQIEDKIVTLKSEIKNMEGALKQNKPNDAKGHQERHNKALKQLEAKRKAVETLKSDLKVIEEKRTELKNMKPDSKPYFLWHLYFMDVFDHGGFDIVIGNPPYIQLQRMGLDADALAEANYEAYSRSGDIYCLFYEKGWQLLKPKGNLCFITSKTWMRTAHGESTRKFFVEKTNPLLLIDFAGEKIFESATVNTNILLFSREKNEGKTLTCEIKEKVLNKLSVFVRQMGNVSSFYGADSWVILSDVEKRIKQKIERIGTPLKDWNVSINYGVKTGFNDAFIIDGAKRKELLKEDPKNEEIIRPILRGRDIRRYGYDFADLWLINTHNGIKENGVKPVKIDNYPAIKKHLDQFYPELEKRADKGDTPYNLRNCAYTEDFSMQKIVWGNLNLNASYTIAPEGYFVNAPCPMIVPANRYLLAVLNSKLADYFIRSLGVTRNGGYFEYKPMFIEQLPVPIIPDKEQEKLASLAEKRNQTNLDSIEMEKIEGNINKLIYKLYDLTEEEINLIDLQ